MSAASYKIQKKKNGRYAVYLKGGKTVNGEEKLKILVDAGVVKQPAPKKKEAVEDVADEQAAAE